MMTKQQLIEAIGIAAKSGMISGIVTGVYGVITNDYRQIIPAIVFSFGTAMSVAGYYDRKAQRLLS